MVFDLGTITHSIAAFFLLALILAQLRIWSTGNSSLVLLGATTISFAWSVMLVFQDSIQVEYFFLVPVVETIKNVAWFALLLSILGFRKLIFPRLRGSESLSSLAVVSAIALGVPACLLLYMGYYTFIQNGILFYPSFGGRPVLVGLLLNAIIGLVLLEQVIRNTREHQRWHLKFLCLSLGILFCYDIYLFSNGLLFTRLQDELWQARGAVVALATPLLAISVLRTREQPMQVNISRRLVFHGGVLMAAGAYLLLMGLTGFYLRNISGEWGLIVQVIFWVISLTLLLVMIYSGRLRSVLKLYINRHLFSSKYDYRDEWMRISNTLSQTNVDEVPAERVLHALADVVDSPGGALWLTTNDYHFDQTAHVEMGWVEGSSLTIDDPLIEYLSGDVALVDLSELQDGLEVRDIPPWVLEIKKAWLLIPLQSHERLLGFVVLKESRAEFVLIWEDYELLKAVSQQAASYLAQMIASDELSEAKQFSAFSQVSAFVVHDLKTLNSQLSLMVRNAEKHKDNPSFIEDMITTTEHAVNKMSILLEHFKSEEPLVNSDSKPLNLVPLLREIVERHQKLRPLPELRCDEQDIQVQGNAAELNSSIGHLVQNAQEATPDDKTIEIEVIVAEGEVIISVTDTGIGMTQNFISTHLFKPFESTKGLAGMGIGVFQCRATIRKLRGDLQVKSEPDQGSKFTITLPLCLD
jgi:putative PEP-CTERM system histidine kinase